MLIHEDNDSIIGNEMIKVGELIYSSHKLFQYEMRSLICGEDCAESKVVNPVHGYTEIRYGICLLPKNHSRGHTNMVFGCDYCGKYHRGTPYKMAEDFQWCFLCDKELERHQYEMDHYGV